MKARKPRCCSSTKLSYGSRTPSEAGFSINLNLYLSQGKSKGGGGAEEVVVQPEAGAEGLTEMLASLLGPIGAEKSVLSVNVLVKTWLLCGDSPYQTGFISYRLSVVSAPSLNPKDPELYHSY